MGEKLNYKKNELQDCSVFALKTERNLDGRRKRHLFSWVSMMDWNLVVEENERIYFLGTGYSFAVLPLKGELTFFCSLDWGGKQGSTQCQSNGNGFHDFVRLL
jgi:hypothetical protein